jgi:hypothetical protein
MSFDNINKFVDYLEYTYSMINIYRAIIIINNITDNELLLLEQQLKNKNHNPIIVKNNNDINYDYRLFIIKDILLLNNFNKDNYNFIAVY